jgi:hypothetical protein
LLGSARSRRRRSKLKSADAVVMAERMMAADRSQGGDATRSDYDFNAKYPWNTHGG